MNKGQEVARAIAAEVCGGTPSQVNLDKVYELAMAAHKLFVWSPLGSEAERFFDALAVELGHISVTGEASK